MSTMTHVSFKREKNSIEQRFVERKRLIKPFEKLYSNPVLVHAIDKKSVFKNIIEEGKLKLPGNHSSSKKTPYMEKLLKIDNGIYYSVGFVYSTAYGWKYNLIFDARYLKDCKYYGNSISYQCYRAVINYWYENDIEYLEELANTNKLCREVVDKYYNEEYNGQKRRLFDFWKIEKYVYDFIDKYPQKKELIKIIKRIEKKFVKKFPASLPDVKESYLTDRVAEIIGTKDNNLLKNKYFLGFHIDGKIPRDIMLILKKKYPGKIIFNGEKIEKI